MALTLRQKQSIFAQLLARLLIHLAADGYEATIGEVYRSPEEAARLTALGKGIPNSLHTLKLAVDLNLFRDGQYLSATSSYQSLGEWWERQSMPEKGIECCWGGRFSRPDGNHFSLAHGGRQ